MRHNAGAEIKGPPPRRCWCCGAAEHTRGCVRGFRCTCAYKEPCPGCGKCPEHCLGLGTCGYHLGDEGAAREDERRA